MIASTESMRRKLEAEYATVDSDLLEKFPKVNAFVGGRPYCSRMRYSCTVFTRF